MIFFPNSCIFECCVYTCLYFLILAINFFYNRFYQFSFFPLSILLFLPHWFPFDLSLQPCRGRGERRRGKAWTLLYKGQKNELYFQKLIRSRAKAQVSVQQILEICHNWIQLQWCEISWKTERPFKASLRKVGQLAFEREYRYGIES